MSQNDDSNNLPSHAKQPESEAPTLEASTEPKHTTPTAIITSTTLGPLQVITVKDKLTVSETYSKEVKEPIPTERTDPKIAMILEKLKLLEEENAQTARMVARLKEEKQQSDLRILKLEAQVYNLEDQVDELSKAEKARDVPNDLSSLFMKKTQSAEATGSKIKAQEAPKRDIIHPQDQMKMKDIVPYSPEEKDLLEKTVGVDYSDTIPPTHDRDAQFVVEKDASWCGNYGKYTGWSKKARANGRGTWREKDGKWRIDSIWVDGRMYGPGRKMDFGRNRVLEGTWWENKAPEDSNIKLYDLKSGSSIVRVLMYGQH